MTEQEMRDTQGKLLAYQMSERALEYRVRSLRHLLYALVLVIVMQILLSASLWSMMQTARDNERTLSRTLFQIGKNGRVTTNYYNAK